MKTTRLQAALEAKGHTIPIESLELVLERLFTDEKEELAIIAPS